MSLLEFTKKEKRKKRKYKGSAFLMYLFRILIPREVLLHYFIVNEFWRKLPLLVLGNWNWSLSVQ